MIIRLATKDDQDCVANLIAKFRVELKGLKGIKSTLKIDQAKEEFREYVESDFPIFIAEDEQKRLLGYLVCRVESGVVWVESLFVTPNSRRCGVASNLYQEAEKFAANLGEETVYNWVHPNNEKMIKFLANRDYNVLNLIEIRKSYKNEMFTEKIRIKNHEYYY